MSEDVATRAPGQLTALVRTWHLRQALAFAVGVGAVTALMGRPPREVAVSAAAILLVQVVLGMVNDVLDVEADARSGVEGKPIAAGVIPRGNVTFAIAVGLLLCIPLALQSGTVAGPFLLATLVVGFVHNRWLHGTVFSWVGWAATFALLPYFVSYGGWGGGLHGSAPPAQFVGSMAALGFCVHFMTSLPDLVQDNAAGVRHLPLRIALRTGAPKLFTVATMLTALATAAVVVTALTVGVAQ